MKIKDGIWINIPHDTGVYLRGVLRKAVRSLKDDEKDYVIVFLRQLEDKLEDDNEYGKAVAF